MVVFRRHNIIIIASATKPDAYLRMGCRYYHNIIVSAVQGRWIIVVARAIVSWDMEVTPHYNTQ